MQHNEIRKRRSMLYIPGNNPAMIQQGGVYGADSILLDLEDAVAPEQKDAARLLVKKMVQVIDFYDSEITVRINHVQATPFGQTDLEVIVPLQQNGRLHAIRIPKVETKAQILEVIEKIEAIEEDYAITDSDLKIHPMIETALGVENAFDIAGASPRIDAITIGGQDLTADMGIIHAKDGIGVDYARRRIVMAAKAYKIDALDTVFADLDDEDGLRAETEYAKKIGFTGKAVINPRQIEIIHEVFNPTPGEIRKALRIVKEFKINKEKGIGVFAVDGKMVDAPVVARAEHVLKLANIEVE
ncbi:MAG: HpcH/HpaI aldolase/citrate lyase family protein [bacterium]|nr:HpcH/HpaI aldolase/citrate lyase family protein [bacterium]